MREVWTRIETWLEANTPEAARALRPPAAPETIARVEKTLRVELPSELRSSLLIHNGQTDDFAVFAPWELLSCDHIVSTWKVCERAFREAPYGFPARTSGPVKPVWWNSLWVPFADDGAGNDLCVDLDPSDGGTPGQVVEYVHDDDFREVLTTGFSAWLLRIVEDLESGDVEIEDGWPHLKRR